MGDFHPHRILLATVLRIGWSCPGFKQKDGWLVVNGGLGQWSSLGCSEKWLHSGYVLNRVHLICWQIEHKEWKNGRGQKDSLVLAWAIRRMNSLVHQDGSGHRDHFGWWTSVQCQTCFMGGNHSTNQWSPPVNTCVRSNFSWSGSRWVYSCGMEWDRPESGYRNIVPGWLYEVIQIPVYKRSNPFQQIHTQRMKRINRKKPHLCTHKPFTHLWEGSLEKSGPDEYTYNVPFFSLSVYFMILPQLWTSQPCAFGHWFSWFLGIPNRTGTTYTRALWSLQVSHSQSSSRSQHLEPPKPICCHQPLSVSLYISNGFCFSQELW